MDSVVPFRLVERHGVVGAVKTVGAVGEPVGPRDERRAVFAVAQGVYGVRVENGPIAGRVLPDAPADFDDGRPLVAVAHFELFPRRGRPFRFASRYLSAGITAAPEMIRSASREARAMIVKAGFAAPWVGQTLPSLMNRLGTAHVGLDPEVDARRYTVSSKGVVVIGKGEKVVA